MKAHFLYPFVITKLELCILLYYSTICFIDSCWIPMKRHMMSAVSIYTGS